MEVNTNWEQLRIARYRKFRAGEVTLQLHLSPLCIMGHVEIMLFCVPDVSDLLPHVFDLLLVDLFIQGVSKVTSKVDTLFKGDSARDSEVHTLNWGDNSSTFIGLTSLWFAHRLLQLGSTNAFQKNFKRFPEILVWFRALQRKFYWLFFDINWSVIHIWFHNAL